MKKIFKLITSTALFGTFFALTACASIVNGTQQSVSVQTGAIQGAMCELQNNKGKWFVNSTPGSVTVHRSYGDLSISCKKKNYRTAFKQVKSTTKAMAFGNVVFGGIIGAGVDMGSGAAYDYPTDINIPMSA